MSEKKIVKETKINPYDLFGTCKAVGYKTFKCPNCPYNDRERDCFLCSVKR